MNNDAIQETLRHMEEVWPRVHPPGPPALPPGPNPPPRPPMGPPPPPEREEQRRLAALIRGEFAAQNRYNAIAARFRGLSARTLRQLAAACGRLLRRLQGEYLLLTGDQLRLPPLPRPHPQRAGEAIREATREAEERRMAYLRAASATNLPRLRLLYGDGAQQALHETELLRQLAEQLHR